MRVRGARLLPALALAATPASAQIPRPDPTPRDVYVSCYLYIKVTDVPKDREGKSEPFSSGVCGLLSLGAIAYREGMSADKDNKLRFCLPDSIDVQANIPNAMAAAYVDWFERVGSRIPNGRYEYAFTIAMIDRWPCVPR